MIILNPFLTVWMHPKQTARDMIDNKPLGFIFVLIAIGSFAAFGSGYVNSELDDTLSVPILVILSLFLGPLVGIIIMFIYSGILFLVGKLLRGTGSFWDIFKAGALTYIPSMVTGFFYYIWMVFSPASYFSMYETSAFSIIVPLLSFVFGVWSIVINIAALAEAHRFSNWRAFFTLLIPFIIVMIFIFVIIAIIGIAFFSMFS